ncbi:ABC transporter substrate-binding protein [Streptantibioticus cattleyicolor]|uniref:Periplasmic binding protein n=1 Tax=Streptantibioticus cattleyicolor (strain ATCC 35852 / DSM 46488 / JCM 4925 / NBRC 14057 / NRRL 8057) TaxID=1003195 RepID=F8JJH5_STREN|nr:ABC transporter substrate-binding protein [Streptantibioticus cattleyicolor]AEW98698.1 periplasmic binding protein [Streptantibioticus cattleyicolor NRRL 8057 = DSM 46488]CCB72245.1 Periplasmic binding protein [Streptantibioticus cattleyicolor NRRL 8057 = DSM 46488]
MLHAETVNPSRRGLLAVGGAVGLGALLTACGSGGGSGRTESGKGGAWSFTDDRGTKVTAGSTPRRIVAYTGTAAALWDFGVRDQLVGVFGETVGKNGAPDPQAGHLDVHKVRILGNVYGEFNVEKYAALRPDLLVTHMYDPGALWYVPAQSSAQILKLAPSVAVTTARVPMTRPIERYAALARSLGADLTARQVTDDKRRFEAAAESVRKAAKANGGLKVMAASGSTDLFYVSNPAVNTDLMYFRQLGVDFVVPQKLDKGGYFESLSWENADKYHADLILLDDRSTALQPKDLAAKPAWSKLPAVKAGQVARWDAVPRFSYAGAAPLLESLAASIRQAKKAG